MKANPVDGKYYCHMYLNTFDMAGMRSLILEGPKGRRWIGKIPPGDLMYYNGPCIKIYCRPDTGAPTGKWAKYFEEMTDDVSPRISLSEVQNNSQANQGRPAIL
jgi:hypothetical protein